MSKKIDLNAIPSTFGVYLWKDINDKIIYVGKSNNIKQRILQYLNGSLNSYKTTSMLEKANDVSFIVCSNEKESLLLEQELIKQHRPYYNILLLDDKKYPFIVLELKKKLEIKVKFNYKEEKNSFYYGPLPTGYGCKIIKDFLIRECLYENGLPIDSNDINFWKQKFDYAKKTILSSNIKFQDKLKKQMLVAAENEQYEIAKEIRDVLNYLSNKSSSQGISFNINENFDVVAFIEFDDYLLITIHHFINGSFSMQEEYIVEISIEKQESINQFINQFYKWRNKPKKIITNIKIEENAIFFTSQIITPIKGKFALALTNAINNTILNKEKKILTYINKKQKNIKSKVFLESILKQEINDFIVIDNSNTNNQDVVSVITYYKKYQPYFSNYRKYIIDQNKKRLSDVEYLNQSLNKYLKNKSNEVPDLIIVDGSKAQISEAKKVLKELLIELPIVGLVKNENHQTSHLIDSQYRKYNFVDNDIFLFFSNIQEEVDKFAKKYHQKKKIQNSLEGFLSTIKGIGNKTETKILNHFKTYTNIYNATEEELKKIVSEKIAKKIMKNLQK